VPARPPFYRPSIGASAEAEIRCGCQDGIERAKRKGTKFGRPSALDVGQKRKIADGYAAGATMQALCRHWRTNTKSVSPAYTGRCRALSVGPREAARTRQGLMAHQGPVTGLCSGNPELSL
jgi:hypothetical protein